MIKKYLLAVLLLQLLLACSRRDGAKLGYDYVKIMQVGSIDSGNAYNKGQGLGAYFYYNPNKDSVLLRRSYSLSNDSFEFRTYEGQFDNKSFTDTISMLTTFLQHHKNGELSFHFDSTYDTYCGPEFSVEYCINGQSHFISFIIEKDTLQKFEDFFLRLRESTEWDRKLVPNNRINVNEEVVHMLKGLGSYDTIVYTPPYVPLPCEKGIKMELLYGKWRTIGDKYNNANLMYTTNTISKDGSWKVKRFIDGKWESRFSGRILSIDDDYTIKVKIKNDTSILKVLNLTENCFEYEVEGSYRNSVWRFDRMK